jgi:hypothetical protein
MPDAQKHRTLLFGRLRHGAVEVAQLQRSGLDHSGWTFIVDDHAVPASWLKRTAAAPLARRVSQHASRRRRRFVAKVLVGAAIGD